MIYYLATCAGCNSDLPPMVFGNEDQRSEWMEAHTQGGPGHDNFGIWAESRNEIFREPGEGL